MNRSFVRQCVHRLVSALAASLILIAPGAGAFETDPRMPSESKLSPEALPDWPGGYRFHGSMTARGILLAYWDTRYVEIEPTPVSRASPIKTLYLRFYPDQASRARLPHFADGAGTPQPPERLFLYRNQRGMHAADPLMFGFAAEETDAIAAELQPLGEIPDEFLARQEGYLLKTVSLRLEGLLSLPDAAHRFTHARANDIVVADNTEVTAEALPDAAPDSYLGRPWQVLYMLARDALLRSAPSHDAPVTARVPATVGGILRLDAVQDGWVHVELPPPDHHPGHPPTRGYLHGDELYILN